MDWLADSFSTIWRAFESILGITTFGVANFCFSIATVVAIVFGNRRTALILVSIAMFITLTMLMLGHADYFVSRGIAMH